jgi:hypothetical protein
MMSAVVTKLPDEPIILVTIEGHLDVTIARDVYAQIAVLAKEIQEPVYYRITDVRKQESTFIEMLAVVKEAMKGTEGTTTDPRMVHIFVGREKMALLARDMLRNINPHNHPMLDTVEDALTYIRFDLGRKQQSSTS